MNLYFCSSSILLKSLICIHLSYHHFPVVYWCLNLFSFSYTIKTITFVYMSSRIPVLHLYCWNRWNLHSFNFNFVFITNALLLFCCMREKQLLSLIFPSIFQFFIYSIEFARIQFSDAFVYDTVILLVSANTLHYFPSRI